jgi:hypothetical protein
LVNNFRHASEGWHPDTEWVRPSAALSQVWIPAFARMTKIDSLTLDKSQWVIFHS